MILGSSFLHCPRWQGQGHSPEGSGLGPVIFVRVGPNPGFFKYIGKVPIFLHQVFVILFLYC